MFKLIITGLIIYFIYRNFIRPAALKQGPIREKRPVEQARDDGEEYTNYEEIK